MKGAFQIARQVYNSDIWLKKPAAWFKIWIYIIGKCNHSPSYNLERGQGMFNWVNEIKNIGYDITPDQIKKFCQYGVRTGMLRTERSTRLVKITVLKYNEFQDLSNYTSTNESTKEALEKHQDNIRMKECKNVNKENILKEKTKFLEYVYLTAEEVKKLNEAIGEHEVKSMIERLNNYIGSTGKKYKSHYYTILNWLKRDKSNIKQEVDDSWLRRKVKSLESSNV